MSLSTRSSRTSRLWACLALLLGAALIAFGWLVPSRFKSVPFGVVREAGAAGESLSEVALQRLLDGNLGTASLMAATALELGDSSASVAAAQVEMEKERNPQLARWGKWDPFLDAALGKVSLEDYSNEPGFLGVLLSEACRAKVAGLLAGSRDPLVSDLLATGRYTSYKRLSPVSSASGRPLEVTLLGMSLLAQGGHFSDGVKRELRAMLLKANAEGSIGALEDVYLDMISLMRMFDWGQLETIVEKSDSLDSLSRLRYLMHRRAEDKELTFSLYAVAPEPESFLDYLAEYGDDGYDSLRRSLQSGIDGYELALREGMPIELGTIDDEVTWWAGLQNKLAPFSLRNPELSLSIKYLCFFLGSFLALFGASRFARFYKEMVSPTLAFTQRIFGATASVLVFAVLSEPYLSTAGAFEGYSFKFVMPVLAEVDGQLQIVETTPSTTMETATLLSIAFFFLLQTLVFLICMLKVREIERRELEPLVKLKLMENEENLFDSGLYVGIAGTCISLVMQVIGLVEANLLAAYSSNLFGILCVAFVKIRLVRPYKTKLIMAGQEKIVELSSKV